MKARRVGRTRGGGRQARPRGGGRIFWRGTVPWIAYFVHKEEVRESVAKTLERPNVTEHDAEALLSRRLHEAALGLVQPDQTKVTVADVLAHHLAYLALKGARALGSAASCARAVNEVLGQRRVVELTSHELQNCCARWLTVVTRGTVGQYMARLKAAMIRAHRQGLIPRLPDVPIIDVDNVRQGFLELEAFEPFAAALPPPLDDVAWFAYLSGWRREEVLFLQWPEVNFRAGEIRLAPRRTKNARGRVVPMFYVDGDGQRQALAFTRILEKRWRERALTPWVFHRRGQQIRRFETTWRASCRAAGVPYMGCQECPAMPPSKRRLAAHLVSAHGVRPDRAPGRAQEIMAAAQVFHDFRRSAVRNMVDAGVPENVAMKVSGHESFAVFQRYNIRRLGEIAQGIRQTELYLERRRLSAQVGPQLSAQVSPLNGGWDRPVTDRTRTIGLPPSAKCPPDQRTDDIHFVASDGQ